MILTVSRPFISGSSSRWSGRTASQKERRKWSIPSTSEILRNMSTISRYSEDDYLVGESSRQELSDIERRLTNGSNSIREEFRAELDSGMHTPTSTNPMYVCELDNVSASIWEMEGDNTYLPSQNHESGRQVGNTMPITSESNFSAAWQRDAVISQGRNSHYPHLDSEEPEPETGPRRAGVDEHFKLSDRTNNWPLI